MGANQSGKSHQFVAPASELLSPASNSTNKNSFSKQQLNRLLNRSLPTQSGRNQHQHQLHKCKLKQGNMVECCSARIIDGGGSGDQRPDETHGREPELASRQRQLSSRSIDCHDERNDIINNNNIDSYFVTSPGAQHHKEKQQRLVSGIIDNKHESASRPFKAPPPTTATTTTSTTNYMAQNTRGLLEHDERQAQDEQQFLVRQHNIANNNNNNDKSNMTPSRQRLVTKQPPNSLHHNHHQASSSSAAAVASVATSRSNTTTKHNKPQQKHLHQQQQLKSSCSPSSASAGSSLASASSSASSSSESFKLLAKQHQRPLAQLQQQQQQQATNMNKQPSASVIWVKLNSSHVNHYSTTPLNSNNNQQQQHQSLVAVAMQHQHRRAHSSGQEQLPWLKEHEQVPISLLNNQNIISNNNINNNNNISDHYQQRYSLLSACPQPRLTKGHHQLDLLGSLKVSPYHSHSRVAPDQHQQEQVATVDQLERFYSGNLHLLTGADLPYDRPVNKQAGFSSAPLQRRYMLPTQHYQYLNSDLGQQQQRQQQLELSVATSTPNYENSSHHYYYDNQGDLHLNNTNPTDDNPNTSQHQASSTLKSRSNSLSTKSPRRKSRSRNPLAAIFPFNISHSSQPPQQQETRKQHFGSNTIHLASSKSHHNLLTNTTTTTTNNNNNNNKPSSQRNSTSSLKRIKSTPLTAQQTSYEAMRTIDMYLIRQIARSCMDFEMEQKIDLEIRLRELALQSMLEASTEIDVLEVEKSLLTSDQRMNCYASQLEQQRKRLSNPSLSADSGRGSKTSQRRDSSLGRPAASRQQGRCSDVVGASATIGSRGSGSTRPATAASSSGADNEAGSPSFSSLSKSSQSSPSKLSPVSGESANSPTNAGGCGGNSSSPAIRDLSPPYQRSRRSNNQVVRQPTSSSNSTANTLNRNHRSHLKPQRHKQRERLAQLITSQSNINCNMTANNRATLSLSELRVPLMWRDVDHFKGRGDYRRYAVFCLVKINSQIYDTQLISDVDRQLTDLTFDDVIIFNQVEHDFELELEVYSCVYLEQFSLSSTPRKLKEKFSNSVSRAMGRRLATQTASVNYTKELEAYDKSYRFAMIASAKLQLSDASDSIKTYDLHLVSPEAHGRHSSSAADFAATLGQSSKHRHTTDYGPLSSAYGRYSTSNNTGMVTASNQKDLHKNTLPLFGHFCCRLHVRPDVFDKYVKSGYLRLANINLADALAKQQQKQQHPTLGGDVDGQEGNGRKAKTPSSVRCDSPANTERTVSSNDDANNTTYHESMLRSALGASSKLAAMSMSSSTIYWALLRNFTLNLWQVDEQKFQQALRRGHAQQVDISRKQPIRVNIDKYARLLRVSNSSLTIETDKGCFVLAVYNPTTATNEHQIAGDEIGQWLRSIEQMIYDSHIWGSVLNHYPPQQHQQQHSSPSNNNNNHLSYSHGIGLTRRS